MNHFIEQILFDDIILIINDCTTLIQNDYKNFLSVLCQLVDKTHNFKILIVHECDSCL